jgi:hypothetical protein
MVHGGVRAQRGLLFLLVGRMDPLQQRRDLFEDQSFLLGDRGVADDRSPDLFQG